MTELRQRMMDAMLVRGLSARTQECYIEAVARMARHYHKSPDLLSPAQVEAYLLHLVKDRQLSYSSVNHAASASRFLFEKVLGRSSDSALRPPMAKVPQKQPELLSREQITRLFACCTHPVHRMALQTLYATGLRVSEVCALRVSDIDSAPDRMCVRVVGGKGGARRAVRGGVQLQPAGAHRLGRRAAELLFALCTGGIPAGAAPGRTDDLCGARCRTSVPDEGRALRKAL